MCVVKAFPSTVKHTVLCVPIACTCICFKWLLSCFAYRILRGRYGQFVSWSCLWTCQGGSRKYTAYCSRRGMHLTCTIRMKSMLTFILQWLLPAILMSFSDDGQWASTMIFVLKFALFGVNCWLVYIIYSILYSTHYNCRWDQYFTRISCQHFLLFVQVCQIKT